MKQSAKNISLVSLTNLINLGLGVILFLAAAIKLSKEDFGIYSLLTLLLVSLSKIIDFGSNSSFVSEFIGKSKNYLNELINFKIVAFIITSIISAITIIFLNKIYDFSIISAFILGLFFYGINYLLFAMFQKDEEFVKASLLNFFPALVKGIFGLLILTNLYHPNLTNTFQIFSISMIASALMIPLKAKELKSFKLDFKIAHFVKNFYLAGVSQIINESWNTISNQIIKLVKSLADLGTFSLASKLSNVFSVISYSIYTVILTSNAKRKRDDLSYNIKESLILGTFLLALASLGTIISPFFFKIFFGNKYDDSIFIFSILLFSQAFASIHKFLDNYFFVEEKSNVLFSLTNFKLFVFVGLSVLLTFNYGLIGIASADLISSVLLTVITFIYIINKSRKA
jgi:O-antigen/teichoic acid export membrane protein